MPGPSSILLDDLVPRRLGLSGCRFMLRRWLRFGPRCGLRLGFVRGCRFPFRLRLGLWLWFVGRCWLGFRFRSGLGLGFMRGCWLGYRPRLGLVLWFVGGR